MTLFESQKYISVISPITWKKLLAIKDLLFSEKTTKISRYPLVDKILSKRIFHGHLELKRNAKRKLRLGMNHPRCNTYYYCYLGIFRHIKVGIAEKKYNMFLVCQNEVYANA
jgi:hypothetical protein